MKLYSVGARLVVLLLIVATDCLAARSDYSAEYLSLGEDRIYYEVSGQGFPLVLVSGGSGMDLRQWDRITPTSSESYRVIRYDPRGIELDHPEVFRQN